MIENARNGFGLTKDYYGNIESHKLFSEDQFESRITEDGYFKYWDLKIEINELSKWCEDIIKILSEEES